jgi:RNA polymerase sigma factor (sigma-70 family)
MIETNVRAHVHSTAEPIARRITRQELVEALVRTARGDRAAFEKIYASTAAKLFGIVIRILGRWDVAEDVLQDVYVRVLQHAGDLDPASGSPITWMATIARNRALDSLANALVQAACQLILRERAPQAASAAEEHFLQSLDWARRQGALSWELRASTSLARLQHHQGRSAEARSLLQSVYDRFSEDFETADLKTAKAYLNSLQ